MGFVVVHRSAQGCRPEGTQISEYDHRLEETRLACSVCAYDRVRRSTEGKYLGGEIAEITNRKIDQFHCERSVLAKFRIADSTSLFASRQGQSKRTDLCITEPRLQTHRHQYVDVFLEARIVFDRHHYTLSIAVPQLEFYRFALERL